MNWFATVLRVVICFIILTDLTEFSVEVLCWWSVRWSRRSRYEEKEERQELKLGDAQGTPSKYSRRLKRLSLGMPQKASPLSSNDHGYFTRNYIFIRHILCVLLGASCMIWIFACFILCFKSWFLAGRTYLREPKLCHDLLELLPILHLNLYELWNCSSSSLIAF